MRAGTTNCQYRTWKTRCRHDSRHRNRTCWSRREGDGDKDSRRTCSCETATKILGALDRLIADGYASDIADVLEAREPEIGIESILAVAVKN